MLLQHAPDNLPMNTKQLRLNDVLHPSNIWGYTNTYHSVQSWQLYSAVPLGYNTAGMMNSDIQLNHINIVTQPQPVFLPAYSHSETLPRYEDVTTADH